MFESPGAVPASRRYDVGVMPDDGAVHCSVTSAPMTLDANPVGGAGTCTAASTSFDARLTPQLLRAWTRM